MDNNSTTIKGKKDHTELKRKVVRIIWITFAAIFALAFILIILIYNGIIGYMPPISQLKNPQDKFASVIYTADGKEMGRYFRNTGNRVYADYSEISQNVVDALIATEDERFVDHSGIDARALGRVFVKTMVMGNKNAGGGSTITQQLAKQLYSPESKGLWSRAMQKPIEWMIAVKLEREYSKEEIIKMYLNQFDFLYNAVGIKSAAHVYFGKDPRDLTIEEAATLVGMVKNPSLYNPRRHPERALARRNTVLEMMNKADKITKAELDSLTQLPMTLDYHAVDHKQGIAPYFREELRRYLLAKKPERSNYPSWDRQRFVDDSVQWAINPLYGWVEKNPKPDGSKYDIYNDGLKIYTTIDSRMQKYAEQAVHEHLSDLQRRFFYEKKGSATAPYVGITEEKREKQIRNAWRNSHRYLAEKERGASAEELEKIFNTKYDMNVFTYRGEVDTVMTPRDSIIYIKHYLRAGFMAMDPRNGYVKAYVGGPNFKYFQYDMVSTGKRQVGSTIKPFLYTLAMEEGMTPCTQFLNSPPVLTDAWGNSWSPRGSSNGRGGEMVDLRWALTNSNNFVSARLINELKPKKLVNFMHNLGITSELPEVNSLCLGPSEISLKEMVTAYTPFANSGMRVDPIFVSAIADNNGNIIETFTPNITEVMSTAGHYKILSILLNVVDGGTGNRLRRAPFNLTAQIGGKTGTTNDNSDGWFMGFTPSLVCGTWVGGDERDIHFTSMANGQGASAALPVYGKFMSKLYADKSLNYNQSDRFNLPTNIDLCEGNDLYIPSEGSSNGASGETVEESIEGAFD